MKNKNRRSEYMSLLFSKLNLYFVVIIVSLLTTAPIILSRNTSATKNVLGVSTKKSASSDVLLAQVLNTSSPSAIASATQIPSPAVSTAQTQATPTPIPDYFPELSPWVFVIPGVIIFFAIIFH